MIIFVVAMHNLMRINLSKSPNYFMIYKIIQSRRRSNNSISQRDIKFAVTSISLNVLCCPMEHPLL